MENDLLERLKLDPSFSAIASEIDGMVDASKFVGRAPQQVEEYIAEEVDPLINEWKHIVPQKASSGIDK
jgi:adenylosuccinate lyase